MLSQSHVVSPDSLDRCIWLKGSMKTNTDLSHLCYAKLGSQARYICFVFVEVSWKHKLRDFKQDGVMFKNAATHQLELRLHPMKPKILTDLMFWNTEMFFAEGKQGYEGGGQWTLLWDHLLGQASGDKGLIDTGQERMKQVWQSNHNMDRLIVWRSKLEEEIHKRVGGH